MKRVLSLVIIAALLICSTAVTVFATSLEELQAQQEELEAKSAEYQRILNEKNSEVSADRQWPPAAPSDRCRKCRQYPGSHRSWR